MSNYFVNKYKKETKRSFDVIRFTVYLFLFLTSGLCFGFAINLLLVDKSSLIGTVLLSVASSIFAGIFTAMLLDISSAIKTHRNRSIKIKHYIMTTSFDVHRVVNVFLKNYIEDDYLSDFTLLAQRVNSNKDKYKGLFKGSKKQIVRYIVQIETETNLFLTDKDSFEFFKNEYEKTALNEILPICYEIKSLNAKKDELELVILFDRVLNYLMRFEKMKEKLLDDAKTDIQRKKELDETKPVFPIKINK